MNPKPTPEQNSFETSPEERKLLQQLRGNPLLGDQLKTITNRFEEEIANGMDAHQAEETMIESLQELGRSMMLQWAHNTQDKLIEQSSELHKHAKKNSTGIPPLDS